MEEVGPVSMMIDLSPLTKYVPRVPFTPWNGASMRFTCWLRGVVVIVISLEIVRFKVWGVGRWWFGAFFFFDGFICFVTL
jgi:hypothetical protein